MKRLMTVIILFSWIVSSCQSMSSDMSRRWEVIAGREEKGIGREPLYRIRVPSHWRRVDPKSGETIEDTTKSLCEFFIDEGNESIRITIHNFSGRIPPMAQISRWQRQAGTKETVIPQSFSGYVGYFLDGSEAGVLGWAMQVGPIQYQTLAHPRFPQQMRADITIKATGPVSLIEKYKQEIFSSVRTFELIEEIPAG